MLRKLLLLLIGINLILPISNSFGQTTFASITGTVSDPSGAVLPGARVSVSNEGEGTVRDLTTGSTGVFSVPNLTVGTYRLQVTAAGFGQFGQKLLFL